jgi:hypothetical protein
LLQQCGLQGRTDGVHGEAGAEVCREVASSNSAHVFIFIEAEKAICWCDWWWAADLRSHVAFHGVL